RAVLAVFLIEVVTLPFAMWRRTVVVKYGISTQSWGGWTVDLLKSWAVGAVIGGGGGVGFFTLGGLLARGGGGGLGDRRLRAARLLHRGAVPAALVVGAGCGRRGGAGGAALVRAAGDRR